MGPPATRSQTKKGESRYEATHQRSISWKPEDTSAEDTSVPADTSAWVDPLLSVFQDLDDSATVRGKDAKLLRDVTADAIADVCQESRHISSRLAQEIRDRNDTLLAELNSSFGAIDDRIRSMPTIATLVPDSSAPRIASFSGTGDGVQFSVWLRRFENIARMRATPMSSEQKANLLIAYLDGIAREKTEELSDEDRRSFESIVTHLKKFFEGPHSRQTLSYCKQETGEPSAVFANRLLHLVRAVTASQDPSTQKERVLEEYVARLHPDIRYFVKLDNISSFEQAVNKAQTVEQLLAEAAADRLSIPWVSHRKLKSVLSTTRARRWQTPERRRPNASRLRDGNDSNRRTMECYNCGGSGHFASQCPSPIRPTRTEIFRAAGGIDDDGDDEDPNDGELKDDSRRQHDRLLIPSLCDPLYDQYSIHTAMDKPYSEPSVTTASHLLYSRPMLRHGIAQRRDGLRRASRAVAVAGADMVHAVLQTETFAEFS